MAAHLIAAGHEVTVWNRTASKAEPLRESGATIAASLRELAEASEAVFLCVNRSEDVRECLIGLLAGATPGTLFVDHSTIAPPAATDIHRDLSASGFRFVDAPVTGGSVGAEKGQLTIFLGGEPADVDEALGLVTAYAKRAERVGGPGCGQMAKMANQIAVGAALLGLCECLSFAEKAGLDAVQMRSLIGGGAGGSWAFENYGPKILERDWTPGFSIKNQRKDFGYCYEAAAQINAAVPCTRVVDALLAKLQEQGHGEWATTALFEEMMRLTATSDGAAP